MKKFDIFLVNLNPKKGHTQAGMRPCVIVQSNIFNTYSSTILVVPLTTVEKKIFPSEFWINPSRKNGLKQKSRFLGSQIITIDKKYFSQKLGDLEKKYYFLVKEALEISLDPDNNFI